MNKLIAFLLIIISLSYEINTKTHTHGYVPEDYRLSQIKINQTVNDVFNMLGSPNLEDELLQKDNKIRIWYYIQDINYKLSFISSTTNENSKIFVIKFIDNKVTEIKTINLKESKQAIKFNRLKTKINKNINELGIDLNDVLNLHHDQ